MRHFTMLTQFCQFIPIPKEIKTGVNETVAEDQVSAVHCGNLRVLSGHIQQEAEAMCRAVAFFPGLTSWYVSVVAGSHRWARCHQGSSSSHRFRLLRISSRRQRHWTSPNDPNSIRTNSDHPFKLIFSADSIWISPYLDVTTPIIVRDHNLKRCGSIAGLWQSVPRAHVAV